MPVKPSVLCLTAGAVLLAQPACATTAGAYLTWSNKIPAASADTTVQGPGGATYAIPPSPYGQVGNPYKATLTWSNRYGPAQPAQSRPAQAQPDPAPAADTGDVASITVPAQPLSQPEARPQPVRRATGRYVDTPPPPQQIEPEDDDAVDGVSATTAPQAAPPPPAPVADAAPASVPVAAEATPVQTADDGAWQVPASSPYAARIAAARAEQAAQLAAADAASAPPPAAPATPAKPSKAAKTAKTAAPAPAPVVATAPAPSEPLSAQATDHVFIPGEQYTSAADAPRFYSLVREYGLKPDPIQVDPNATGALLEPLQDVRTDDDKADDDNKADNDDTSDDGDDGKATKNTDSTQ